MKTLAPVIALAITALATAPTAHAADEPQLQRLALCQDSWYDWKDDDARMARFASDFESRFERSPQGDAFAPKTPTQAFGRSVTQVYPQSVGMGVGFSLVVNADFAQARAAIEQQLGRPMSCTTGEGVRSCELKLGPKKTALLMTGQNGQAKTSRVGCDDFDQQ
jgi:hypothetical protein